jgi:glucose-1-phosphate thymidylyltransferase
VEEFKDSKAAAEIELCHVPNPQSFSVADVRNGKIIRLIEKPKDPPSDLALVGIFRKQIFDAIRRLNPSWKNELEITDAIQILLDEKLEVQHHLVKGWWKDTGKPRGYPRGKPTRPLRTRILQSWRLRERRESIRHCMRR